jgi:mono/diheme cytochrome c family protein
MTHNGRVTLAKETRMIPTSISSGRPPALRRQAWTLIAILALGLTGCAVEVENRQAAREVARLSQPPGSIYSGWRVYEDKCARCHGTSATAGTGNAPDLLASMRTLGPQRFVTLVLQRYDWNLPVAQGTSMDALVEQVMERRTAVLSMPAWQTEPAVNAHIMDLHAYLSARADGTQGPGRPTR